MTDFYRFTTQKGEKILQDHQIDRSRQANSKFEKEYEQNKNTSIPLTLPRSLIARRQHREIAQSIVLPGGPASRFTHVSNHQDRDNLQQQQYYTLVQHKHNQNKITNQPLHSYSTQQHQRPKEDQIQSQQQQTKCCPKWLLILIAVLAFIGVITGSIFLGMSIADFKNNRNQKNLFQDSQIYSSNRMKTLKQPTFSNNFKDQSKDKQALGNQIEDDESFRASIDSQVEDETAFMQPSPEVLKAQVDSRDVLEVGQTSFMYPPSAGQLHHLVFRRYS